MFRLFPSFTLFGKEIAMYTVCALLGIFIAGIFAIYQTKRKQLNDDDMLIVLLFGALGAFLGSHILYAVTNFNYIAYYAQNLSVIKSFSDFLDAATIIFGGSVFYGGLIGGLIAGAITLNKKKLAFNPYTDIAAPAIPLFHAFGRIGCFFGGCCYGIPSDFGITFTNSPDNAANGISRFPVSLLEATFNILLFIFLYICLKKCFFKGKLIYLYLIIYSVGRFFIEFLRDDDIRGGMLCLSTSQWISILLLIVTIIVLLIKRYRAASDIR